MNVVRRGELEVQRLECWRDVAEGLFQISVEGKRKRGVLTGQPMVVRSVKPSEQWPVNVV